MATLTFEVSDLVMAIRDRIDDLNISDAEAARRLDVSPQRLNGWKRGSKVNLDGDLQQRLCEFLGVSHARIVELLGLSVSSEPVEPMRPYLTAA